MITLPDGTEIRTEPQEFESRELKQQLAALHDLIPKLEPYAVKEFRELPDALKKLVRESPFAPKITVAGLERMFGVIWKLTSAEQAIERLIAGKSAARLLGSFFGVDVPEPVSTQAAAGSEQGVAGTLSVPGEVVGGQLDDRTTSLTSEDGRSPTSEISPAVRSPDQPPSKVSRIEGTLVVESDLESTDLLDRPPTLRI